jgi:hypothetical protein
LRAIRFWHIDRWVRWIGIWSVIVASRPAAAQPAQDDTPSVHIGATLYADYTYQDSPTVTDANGNEIHTSAFNVSRSYINVTGNLSHLIAFRVTPDITRETGSGTSLNGSLVFRVKYAYAQVNLDDWMPRGSWVRLGVQQTPWLDYEEGIYRYRFQGTMFPEREGYFASADAGAGFHYTLPDGWGDLHAGVYNGENYNRLEVNNEKALMVRGTVRPFTHAETTTLQGLRATVFYDLDAYVQDGPRRRFIGSMSFEHPRLNAAFEYLATTDRRLAALPGTNGRGFSIWATPRSPSGWEVLLRYDHLRPDTSMDGTRSRTIVGMAYWFPLQGSLATAFMVDYDGQTFGHGTPEPPADRRVAVHGLLNF